MSDENPTTTRTPRWGSTPLRGMLAPERGRGVVETMPQRWSRGNTALNTYNTTQEPQRNPPGPGDQVVIDQVSQRYRSGRS